jgi:methyl-accepting chemotaxis protein
VVIVLLNSSSIVPTYIYWEIAMKNAFNDVSVKVKILGNVVALLLMAMVSYIFALIAMSEVDNELGSIAKKDIPITSRLTTITERYFEQAILFERALKYGMFQSNSKDDLYRVNVKSFVKNGDKVVSEIDDIENFIENSIANSINEVERNEYKDIKMAIARISDFYQEYKKHAEKALGFLEAGLVNDAEKVAESMEQEEKQLAVKLEGLVDEIEKYTQLSVNRIENRQRSTIIVLTIISALSLIVGLTLGWVTSNNVSLRLCNVARRLEVIATGDLTQPQSVDGEDEIGHLQKSMQSMHKQLRGMIKKIHTTTVQLAASSEQLSAVTTQSCKNIEHQQIETDQMATAMNEMASTVHEVAVSVTNTSNAARDANMETVNSRKMVDDAVQGMLQLAKQIDISSEDIVNLAKDGENINTVLEVIKVIAEQTNLLALNAAIEAARAGEQGRGFAVVADEVRTLAGRTQESTAEINQIIEKLQTGSIKAVDAMTLSREKAKGVVEQATMAEESLQAIASSASDIDQMSSQIATAAEEQSSVADEMNRSIIRVNDMAAENSAGAKQTEQAGIELARMASELQAIVKQFDVD